MAQKEATVYIVDCGNTMGETSQARKESNLDFALQYVWDKITTTIATGRKTAMAGVIGLRTEETENMLSSEEAYQNISIFQGIAQLQMPQVRHLREQLKVSGTNSGDAISALVVAIQMISETCKKLQYQRRIILVTDARGGMEVSDTESIVSKMKEDKIELTVLGVDFDDADYGFKEESKDEVKAANESSLSQFCNDCDGVLGTLAQAVEELQIPRTKTVRPTPNYRGYFTLGDPEEHDTALVMDVERYPKTMVASVPTASKFVVRNDMAVQEAPREEDLDVATRTQDGLAGVQSARTYQISDEGAPGGKRDIDPAELSKGYEYGRTAVHISESDRNVTTYETKMGFDIMGFVEAIKYERYLDMSRACMTIAQKSNDKASMALSSLIHALYEMESYAVARLVPKDLKEPRILLLAPHIEPDFECLYDVELPFAEDVRTYKFPPLDRVVTVSGKELKVHRNLPNDELQDAMDAYVDSLDLSETGQDADGEAAEYAAMDETFNPAIHRLNQAIKHRAIYPENDPPPAPEILLRYSQPPAELIKCTRKHLDRVVNAANIKKVPPKARGKRFRGKEVQNPLSDLDIGALLAQDPARSQKRIDPKNAVPEFKQYLDNAESFQQVDDACKQLQQIIYDWIRNSVGSSGYRRSIEAIGVMRQQLADLDMPQPYNDFLKDLKEKVLGESLGGDRKEMWYLVRVARLRPISVDESAESDISDEAAKAFMSAR